MVSKALKDIASPKPYKKKSNGKVKKQTAQTPNTAKNARKKKK